MLVQDPKTGIPKVWPVYLAIHTQLCKAYLKLSLKLHCLHLCTYMLLWPFYWTLIYYCLRFCLPQGSPTTHLPRCHLLPGYPKTLTPEGLDFTFATNYVGPFLLTNLLQGKEGWVLVFCATPTSPFPWHFHGSQV